MIFYPIDNDTKALSINYFYFEMNNDDRGHAMPHIVQSAICGILHMKV